METNKTLTAQESLDIITEMIQEAKGNVQRNGFYFLFWGWVVALANAGMFVLYQIDYAHPYAVWAITIPAWILSLIKGYRQQKIQPTRTHFDKVTMWLWASFGITIFTLVAFGSVINYQLNPIILLMSAIPTLVSGVILRFRPLMLGAAAFWVFGIVSFLMPKDTQPLIGAIAIICGYLVPGYLIKSQRS